MTGAPELYWLIDPSDAEPTVSMRLRIGKEAVFVIQLNQDDLDNVAPLSNAEITHTQQFFESEDNPLRDFRALARKQHGGGNGAAVGSVATKRGKQAEQQTSSDKFLKASTVMPKMTRHIWTARTLPKQ